MDVAIPLFERFTALDAIGPYEVLWRIPGARVSFVAREPGQLRTDNGMLALTAERSLAELPHPEVVVVPGGIGSRTALEDRELVGWIRSAHETSRWTTSVCTGALLLGAAGVLEGLEATTHFAELETLRRFGAKPVRRRYIEQGKVVTAAGVSAGIDMALALAARVAEYDPAPPFGAGSLETASPEAASS
jgi:transcriptional regulator GlxA family with amidase domain